MARQRRDPTEQSPHKPVFIYDTRGEWHATKIGDAIYDTRGEYVAYLDEGEVYKRDGEWLGRLNKDGHSPEERRRLEQAIAEGKAAREHLIKANTRLVVSTWMPASSRWNPSIVAE